MHVMTDGMLAVLTGLFLPTFSAGFLSSDPISGLELGSDWVGPLPLVLFLVLTGFSLWLAWLWWQRRHLKEELRVHEHARVNFLVKSEKADLEGNRARDMFLTQVSHVLKTPLNVIIGYSELLSENCAERGYDDVLEDIQKIQISGRDLAENIDHMLQFTKLASGPTKVDFNRFSTAFLIADLKKTIQAELRRAQNRFEVVEDEMPAYLDTDVEKLRHILLHILLTAIRAARDSMVRLQIRPGSGRTMVDFIVETSGEGLPEILLDQLFREDLGRGQLGRPENTDTRLGLVICKTMCRTLGGDLILENRPHEGARFQVSLPALTDISWALNSGAGGQGGRRRILLIDDDPEKIATLGSMLHDEGLEVETYLANDHLPRFSRFRKPDLIVADAMMTRLRGRRIYEGLCNGSALSKVPLLLMTMMDDVGMTYRLGGLGYLVKPVKESHLLNILNRILPGKPKAPILLVEDDRTTRLMMRRTLERAGWHVMEAATSHEALEKSDAKRPALILLDLILEGMSGYDFFRKLRERPGRETVPVIFVSANYISSESRLGSNHVHLIHYSGGPRDDNPYSSLKRQILTYANPDRERSGA